MSPTLIVSPSTDEIFAEYANLAMDLGATTVADLERRLRPAYPRATVHARDLSGETAVVWYVYRDGRWTAPEGPVDSNAVAGGSNEGAGGSNEGARDANAGR